MSVDLSKCKVGDMVITRCERTVSLVDIQKTCKYPFLFSDRITRTKEGLTYIGCSNPDDIISLFAPAKPAKRKVATFEIKPNTQYAGWFEARCFLGMWVKMNYTKKSNAIRGAKRFCEKIGFECVIKEVE